MEESMFYKQIHAALVLQHTEEYIEEMIKNISSSFPESERTAFEKGLRELADLCMTYGRVKFKHENLLKDGQRNT